MQQVGEVAVQLRDYISIGGLLISLTVLCLSLFDRRSKWWKEQVDDLQAQVDKLQSTVETLGNRIIALETQVGVFWKGVAYSSAQALHSPHTPLFDSYVERFRQDQLSQSELVEFRRMVIEIAEDGNESNVRRRAALNLMMALHVQYDEPGAFWSEDIQQLFNTFLRYDHILEHGEQSQSDEQ